MNSKLSAGSFPKRAKQRGSMLIAQNVSAAADFKTFISYSNKVASGDGILEIWLHLIE
jgi:hypothetical protein